MNRDDWPGGDAAWQALLAAGVPEHALLAYPDRDIAPWTWVPAWADHAWRVARVADKALVCRGRWKGSCAWPVAAVLTRSASRGQRRRYDVRTGYCADHLAAQWNAWVIEDRVARWRYRRENEDAPDGPTLSIEATP